MNVTKSVSTLGSRDDAAKAGPPNIKCSKRAPKDHKEKYVKLFTENNFDYDETALNTEEASRYRALTARANYLAQDRPDIEFSVKEVARRMARPRQQDWIWLKRLARYLIGAPRAAILFHWHTNPQNFEVYVDADWAGCKSTGRSIRGGQQFMDGTL